MNCGFPGCKRTIKNTSALVCLICRATRDPEELRAIRASNTDPANPWASTPPVIVKPRVIDPLAPLTRWRDVPSRCGGKF